MPLGVFLFTDIEGSTRLWAEHQGEMGRALERHDKVLSEAVERMGGQIFKHTGDGLCAVFSFVSDAVTAAAAGQRGLAGEDWGSVGAVRARMAIHAGNAEQRDGDWFGPALNRTARLLGIGHGGQVLISGAAHELASDDGLDSFLDLGVYRLRDLTRPEHVWQLTGDGLEHNFPPPRTFQAHRGVLPTQTTSFVGREGELDAISTVLASTRLVTLVGPGGMGKTRLAAQIGLRLLDKFPDGVWMFELAALTAPGGLEPSILTTLGRSTVAGGSPRQALIEVVQQWRALLIIDNCEHLLRPVSSLVRELITSADELTVLATSREPLHLPGEHVVTVGPLPVTDDAVALFIERSPALRHPSDASAESRGAVARICAQLDGVPLAIELAAARTVAMTPQEIERRLDQRFRLLTNRAADTERHGSLRRVLDWSYDLLASDTAAFFRRVCVFVGNFDAGAAHAICGGDDELATIDMLTDLVDKSLLTATPLRDRTSYHLLETMRQYGRLRVDDQEHALLRNAHAHYFADLVDRSWSGLRGHEHGIWRDVIDDQFDNIRSAMEKALLDHDADVAVRITGGLYACRVLPRGMEVFRWIEQTMALPGVDEHPMAPRFRLHRSLTLARSGDLEAAKSELKRVLAGTEPEAAALRPLALMHLAVIVGTEGNLSELERLANQSVEECRRLGPDFDCDRAEALWVLCALALFRDAPESAPTRELLEIGRTLGSDRILAGALLMSGGAERNYERSVELLTEARITAQQAREPYYEIAATAWLGVVQSERDPYAALDTIPALLDYARLTGDQLTLVQRSRDLLSPLAAVGRYADVATLDGATTVLSIRPALVARAIAATRLKLGEETYEQLTAVGENLSTDEFPSFLSRLWTEIDAARQQAPRASAGAAPTSS